MAAHCLTHALDYLALGWSVIPLCPPGCTYHKDCANPGKLPLLHWKTYQERLPTEKELRVYWNRWPDANVGVVLGAVSGHIALDVDGPDALLLLNKLGTITTDLCFTTPGGGLRLFYALPSGLIVPRRRYGDKNSHVLLLGEGSYTVMPPSVHPNGASYQWHH